MSAPSPQPSWAQRLRTLFLEQLRQGVSPEKLALTIALGSALALFPILGTTTVLCLAAAWALRLNQPLIHVLNQSLFPLQFASIALCVALGRKLVGGPEVELDFTAMLALAKAEPGRFLSEFGATVGQAVLAWLILAPQWTTLLYVIVLPLFRRFARRTSIPSAPSPHGS